MPVNKMNISIREMLVSDAKAIAHFLPDLGYRATEKDIERRFSKLSTLFDNAVFVAEWENIVVGWCHIYGVQLLESDGYVEIGGLVVSVDHQRKGIGTTLIRHSEQWAIKHKYNRLRLRSGTHREEAHYFYESVGYSKAKVSYAFERWINDAIGGHNQAEQKTYSRVE